jgi:hypothetical protein
MRPPRNMVLAARVMVSRAVPFVGGLQPLDHHHVAACGEDYASGRVHPVAADVFHHRPSGGGAVPSP